MLYVIQVRVYVGEKLQNKLVQAVRFLSSTLEVSFSDFGRNAIVVTKNGG